MKKLGAVFERNEKYNCRWTSLQNFKMELVFPVVIQSSFKQYKYFVDGCRSGFFGHRCINKCKYPNYGKGCQSNCGCLEENCNFINGCYIPESKI